RKLLRFPHGYESGAQRIGDSGSEDESARFDSYDTIHAMSREVVAERVDDRAETAGMLEQRRNVVEEDSRLRIVGDLADQSCERACGGGINGGQTLQG